MGLEEISWEDIDGIRKGHDRSNCLAFMKKVINGVSLKAGNLLTL